jgi:hypothetical protein
LEIQAASYGVLNLQRQIPVNFKGKTKFLNENALNRALHNVQTSEDFQSWDPFLPNMITRTRIGEFFGSMLFSGFIKLGPVRWQSWTCANPHAVKIQPAVLVCAFVPTYVCLFQNFREEYSY